MREYNVEQTSVECRWIYKRMLPSLPGPGTPAFAKLVKELAAFGIDPSGVTVDAPSSRMSDIVVGIVLLEKRVVGRITASSFDLFVTSLLEGDESSLVAIADLILNALREIDSDVDQAEVSIRTSSHLSLVSADVEEFLGEHLNLSPSMVGFVPDAVAYKVGATERTHFSEVRLVIARSIGYANSVFIDLNAKYSEAPNVEVLATWIMADFDGIMEQIRLKEAQAKS